MKENTDGISEWRLNRRSFIGVGSGLMVSAAVPFAHALSTGNAVNKDEEKKKDAKETKPLSAEWNEPLSKFILESQSSVIPEETRELAKRHILDTLAAVVACRDLDASVLAQRFVLPLNIGNTAAPVLGSNQRCALLDAILASAMRSHAAEINDYFTRAYVQPGGPVVSSTLCLGEARGLRGEELLRAVIVGYEISCRMPMAVGLRNLQYIGLASHSLGPLWGSAAAVASMIRLSEEKIKHMLSYCTQQTSGHWQWLRDEDHVEKAYVFAGLPAQKGAQAALFAEAGWTGIGDTFTGAPGFFTRKAFLNKKSDFKPEKLTEDLGVKSILPKVSYKRYPTGGPTQPAVDAMLTLVKRIDPKKVASVQIEMPYPGHDENLDPYRYSTMPALNLPYLMSIILLDGKLDFAMAESRDRMNNDIKVAELKKIVSVVHDPTQEQKPRARSARVTITLKDGTKLQDFVKGV
jgi:2-methylcitrate dehydratase PrpD